MSWVTYLSFVYAGLNMAASFGLNFKLPWGPWVGCLGALVGFGVGFHSVDAKGMMLVTPVYFTFGAAAIIRNHIKERNCEEE